MKRPRFATLALMVSAFALPSRAQAPKLDRLNDPLPEGAVARLGTGRFCHRDSAGATAWSPKGDQFASAGYSQGGTIVWEWPSGKKLRELPDGARRLVFSPDGRWLGALGAGLQLWDLATGNAHQALAAKLGPKPAAFAFSVDGTRLAVAGEEDWLVEWRLDDNTFRKGALPPQARILALGYNARNELLAAGKLNDKAMLWTVAKD